MKPIIKAMLIILACVPIGALLLLQLCLSAQWRVWMEVIR